MPALATMLVVLSGHVGTYDAWFEGDAGAYPVQVVIRAPGVIPGLAEILIRVHGDGVERVTAAAAYWTSGPEGVPPADVAEQVPGEPDLWTTRLWLMNRGSYRVHVTVDGTRGGGEVVIPYDALATTTLEMDATLGWILAGFGAFLFIGVVTIVGSATREGTLPPGREPDTRSRRRAVWTRVAAASLLVLLLTGGKRWWDAEDARYRSNVWEPNPVEVGLEATAQGFLLSVELTGPAEAVRTASPLIPDHGRMMHLFMVDSATTAMAHLHPVRVEETRFVTPVPPLPAGSYRVFAEAVHATGFRRTMVGRVELPPIDTPDGWRSPDPEDGWILAGREAEDDRTARLNGGKVMIWERGDAPLTAGDEAPLRFTVRDGEGNILPLEPYLGMAGHAAIAREDGGVFVHLHPTGTTSAAAETVARLRATAERDADLPVWRPGDDRDAFQARLTGLRPEPEHAEHHHQFPGDIRFPWGFPAPGRYRIWVQVRHAGEVLTGAFVAEVDETASDRSVRARDYR